MPTPVERHRLIAEAAYSISERRGFQSGSSEEDWLQAEREVDAQIAASIRQGGTDSNPGS